MIVGSMVNSLLIFHGTLVSRYFDENGELIQTDKDSNEENVKLFSGEVGTFTALDFIDMLLNNITRNEAAAVIQRSYLRFQLKMAIRKKHLEHQHELGMLELKREDHSSEYEQIKVAREKRRKRKSEFDKAFIRACEDDKARILRLRTPYIMEDISDHIRYWFREMYSVFSVYYQL